MIYQVIISSLGSHTINWIKKRRGLESHAKVAMTFQSEKRLRKIFNAFDFGKTGSVSLDDFHKAIDFCRQSKSFHRLAEKLDELEQV
jgi:Ca2+-binding EF-hand superfamily protein